MTEQEYKARTKRFAVEVIGFVRELPREVGNDVMGRQLLRSATSVAANYRAMCRSRSTAEALARFAVVEEEADESLLWIELLNESGCNSDRLPNLMAEADQLVALAVSSIRTMRKRLESGENGRKPSGNPKSKIHNPKSP